MEPKHISRGTSLHLGGLDPADIGNAFEGTSIERIAGSANEATSAPVTTAVDALIPRVMDGLDGAQSLIDQGMSAVENAIALASAKAGEVANRVEAYTRREPINALLIAASAAAFVSVVMSLTKRRR